ncbi:M6 family metalloprotease-like protein [Tahibacter aquaticus]|uniref:M6 family metalloprotease-like protein n=1 Tax=Tahibacter aquaticus TaxID=520092 RepID=A0A4R6ZA40_9GAMM|nr:hypothetical protein [Tahibacter aquaticus]TDR48793.1 M6 family metalloprotease-like protein [Tahibacter aquaticus]
MTRSTPLLLALASSLFGSQALAAPIEGRLELIWGDTDPVAGLESQFRVSLVDDNGLRYALDPEQARLGAGDIYALAGKRVAVDLATAATAQGLAVRAIVPADEQRGVTQPDVAGTTVWATLLCKFSDIATEQKPLSFFNGQYGNSPGQLDHYWREVSYNKINLVGSAAYGWFTLPQPRSFYVPASGSANLNKLFDDCTAAANASVNFAANGGLQGVNMMFNGDLDGYAWGGSRCATLDGINKCWSSTWNPPWSFSNSAPLSHEMGHAYGLPHANNSDNDSDPYDNPWDVMSDAWSNAATDTTYGKVAKHISTWSRDKLGFIDAARKRTLNTDGYYPGLLLDRASLIGSANLQMIVVTLAGQPATKFYTIEARKRGGKYESALAGDAVIIHSIDTTRSTPAWSVDADSPPANTANNEGSMFKVGETWTVPGNAFSVKVDAATAEGFSVTVTRGTVSTDPIFKGNFQAQ